MRILVFGDSIAQGQADTECFGWVNRLAAHAQARAIETDFEMFNLVLNVGVPADRSVDVLARFESEARARGADEESLVIFAVGINDAARTRLCPDGLVPLEKSEETLAQLFAQAKALVGRVMVVGLTRVDESRVSPLPASATGKSWQNDDIARHDAMIEKLVAREGFTYIPVADLVEPALLVDGIHPSTEVHRRMYERVKGVLEHEYGM